MKPRVWHCWVITARLGHRDDPVMLGIGWFGDELRPYYRTPGLTGPPTATFRTRETARDAIKAKGLERYKARAVQATCTVRAR